MPITDWRRPLGSTIPPDNIHAISATIGTHSATVGYEEGDPEVVRQLKQAYPRFVSHELVKRLVNQLRPNIANDDALHFTLHPSAMMAKLSLEFSGVGGEVVDAGNDLHAAIIDKTDKSVALSKAFSQHAGSIISSRHAEAVLSRRYIARDNWGDDYSLKIRDRIAGFVNYERSQKTGSVKAFDVFLSPTGMSSIFQAHRMIKALKPNTPTVQFGFPYVDSFKIQQKFNGKAGVRYVAYNSDHDFKALEQRLEGGAISAIFVEVPGNPLLKTPNLKRLRELCDRHDVILAIDDTVGSWANVDLTPYADITLTSLTKSFSGGCDVMGGAAVLHPDSRYYQNFKKWMQDNHEDQLYVGDAKVLNDQSKSFLERSKIMSENALATIDILKSNADVEQVFHPSVGDTLNYDAVKKPSGNYGGLLSFQTRDPQSAWSLYDKLGGIQKGPSLGANESLACLYTLLAHYGELPWAAEQGVAKHLIRVSAGLDNPAGCFERALSNI